MNKAIINDEIVIAYDVLKKSEIVENGKIKKTWRGTSSFLRALASALPYRIPPNHWRNGGGELHPAP